MPGYEQWAKMAPQIPAAVKLGSINAEWAPDSKSFDYMLDGKRWRFDLTTRKAIESTDAPQAETATAHPPTGTVLARGRGREAATPPNARRRQTFALAA